MELNAGASELPRRGSEQSRGVSNTSTSSLLLQLNSGARIFAFSGNTPLGKTSNSTDSARRFVFGFSQLTEVVADSTPWSAPVSGVNLPALNESNQASVVEPPVERAFPMPTTFSLATTEASFTAYQDALLAQDPRNEETRTR